MKNTMTIIRKLIFITCIFISFSLVGCSNLQQEGIYNPWERSQQSQQQTRQVPPAQRDGTKSYPTPPESTAQTPAFDNAQPVKVAILLPLSGPKSHLGQSMLQAAQLALFDMGYNNFNLIPRDTRGNAQGASEAARSAINDGAQLILGPLFSDSVRAAQAVASSHNINMIAFSTDWSLANKKTYLMGFMPFSQVERVANYAVAKGYRDFAVIAPTDKYGDMTARQFTQSVQNQNGRIRHNIRYVAGDPAVTEKIKQLASVQPQAVFMPVGGSQTELISSTLSYNKLYPNKVKRIGTGLWDDPRIAAQTNMNGGWFAAPSPRQRAAFEQRYRETYNQSPIRLASLAYDASALAIILAQNGIQHSGKPDYSSLAITNPSGFAGIDGIFRFRPNGLIQRGLAVLEIRDGRIVEVDPAPQKF